MMKETFADTEFFCDHPARDGDRDGACTRCDRWNEKRLAEIEGKE